MGGGAAGWCSQVISMNSPSHPFSLKTEKQSLTFQVFRADCGTTVHAKWVNASQLQIAFYPRGDSDNVDVYMKQHDNSGAISIHYVFGPSASTPSDNGTTELPGSH